MARRSQWSWALAAAVALFSLLVLVSEELKGQAETFGFQAEVSRLMKLIVNSLYKNKEIFLRELISNASDALDKIRFLALTQKDALGDNTDLRIDVRGDPDAKIITITDTGIGMTRKDLVTNLGTVAKSGTADFMQSAEENGDLGLIGQFGVGFYSAFLVADRVTVVSKNNDDDQHIWESTADGDFSVVKDPRGNTLGRGTQIILHLKDEAVSFAHDQQMKELVKKYSEFINFPIYVWTKKTEEVDAPVDEPKAEDDEEKDDGAVEDVDDADTTADAKPAKIKKEVISAQRVNENKPIWTRAPEDLTMTEYHDFYKMFAKEETDPLAYTHFKAEGELDFKAILYIPPKPPANLWVGGQEGLNFIKLFVKRVFITDEMPDLLPRYLKFIKGVVDSDDLPLNVSRETLQQHKLMRLIRKKLTRKILDMLKKLSIDDPERYLQFHKQYANAIKFGIIEDLSNRERLAELLRFPSSRNPHQLVSLEDYVKRMKKGQEHIYLLAGQNLIELDTSPLIERLKARGYEVLYLLDPVDEWTFQSLADYHSIRFQDVAKEGVKLGDDDEEEEDEVRFAPLTSWLTEVLAQQVDKVSLSNRLTTSPCTVLAAQYGVTGNMERIMKAQAYQNSQDDKVDTWSMFKKKLEINPRHPVIVELLERVSNGNTDEHTVDLANVLYNSAALRAGYGLKNDEMIDFSTRIDRLIRENLGVDKEAQAEVNETEAEDKEPEDGDDTEEDEDHDHDEL